MKVLIIEDEKLAADRLQKMLLKEDEGSQVVAMLDTVAKSVEWLRHHPAPDLILLDIELGDGKSFDIFQKVDVSSHIIFITAFDEYAIKAFKYNSIDYLLKPLKKKDLVFALEKFKKQLSFNGTQVNISPVIKEMIANTPKTRFLVRQATELISIKTAEVAYVYTRDRCHYIKTNAGEDYQIDNNLEELELQLDPHQFFRVNRQFIVSFSSIRQMFAWFDSKLKITVTPAAYEDIIISRLKANEFKKWLNK
jgi:DNA-binding LytR/AlgR family response regulator